MTSHFLYLYIFVKAFLPLQDYSRVRIARGHLIPQIGYDLLIRQAQSYKEYK